MQTMRESWTDERLDDLNERVGEGFDRVEVQVRDLRGEMDARLDKVDARFDRVDERFEAMEAQFDKRFDKVDERFEAMEAQFDKRFDRADVKSDRIEARLDSIQRGMIALAMTVAGSMIAGFGAMIALFATQF